MGVEESLRGELGLTARRDDSVQVTAVRHQCIVTTSAVRTDQRLFLALLMSYAEMANQVHPVVWTEEDPTTHLTAQLFTRGGQIMILVKKSTR